MDFFLFFFYPDWRGLELWSKCLLSFFNSLSFSLNSPFFVTSSCRTLDPQSWIVSSFPVPHLNTTLLCDSPVYWLTSTAHIIIISFFCCYATNDTYFGWITFWISTHTHTVGRKTGDAVSKPVNCIVKWGNRVVNIAVLFSFVKSVLHELFKRDLQLSAAQVRDH